MTRLTEGDVRDLTAELERLDDYLIGLTGVGLRGIAMRAVSQPPQCLPLRGSRIAAVPVSSGEGFIPGFSQCVVAILEHLGCEAWVTAQADVRGLQEAAVAGAEIVFTADDFRFIALNLGNGRCVDNDVATADGYATALQLAAGSLLSRHVLLLGLGPVGRAAARRLVSRGAAIEAVEPDPARLQTALDLGLKIQPVSLEEGLQRCDLVFDATPAADLIDETAAQGIALAAVPGMPSAFTRQAQTVLGARHIHEPLALGVAVMAARALA